MRNLLFVTCLFSILAMFTSCDRWGNYQYQIKNKTTKFIDVSFQGLENAVVETKTIKPGDSLVILKTKTENLGKHEKPAGIWKISDTINDIEKIEIKIDRRLIDTDFRLAKYWIYNAENLKIGKYNLEIK